jgi:hypothetical protein
MLDLLFGPLGGVLAAFLGVLGLWVKSRLDRRQGAKDQQAKDAKDAVKRIERGTNAIDRGGDPAERLRRNDGRW